MNVAFINTARRMLATPYAHARNCGPVPSDHGIKENSRPEVIHCAKKCGTYEFEEKAKFLMRSFRD